MPSDTEYNLKQKVEALQSEVRSLNNLLYEVCYQVTELSNRLEFMQALPRVRAWWGANHEKLAAQREEESRMEAAARLRKEREYETLRRELGKDS